ncbi:MAG: hypothetical protein L6Q71_01580 [Planctomycetes bacterium]|nr:hypothetical protein [Planctomycetota bacterium]NUQ35582.1 hypothetical protein [Planctomycetaceae bacterium]
MLRARLEELFWVIAMLASTTGCQLTPKHDSRASGSNKTKPITAEQYITPAMLVRGEPGLSTGNATTVLGCTLTNCLRGQQLELKALTLEFELTSGEFILPDDLQATIYIDKNKNGVLDEPGFSSHVFGEAALTPRIFTPSLTKNVPVQLTFMLSIHPQFKAEYDAARKMFVDGDYVRRPILPSDGAVNVGIEIWNVAAAGTVRFKLVGVTTTTTGAWEERTTEFQTVVEEDSTFVRRR